MLSSLHLLVFLIHIVKPIQLYLTWLQPGLCIQLEFSAQLSFEFLYNLAQLVSVFVFHKTTKIYQQKTGGRILQGIIGNVSHSESFILTIFCICVVNYIKNHLNALTILIISFPFTILLIILSCYCFVSMQNKRTNEISHFLYLSLTNSIQLFGFIYLNITLITNNYFQNVYYFITMVENKRFHTITGFRKMNRN